MKKYAIIGASGLIGSQLTKELLDSSQVFAFSRNPLKIQHPNLNWTRCNLESESVTDKIPQDIDAIIYLAQSEHFRDFPQKATEVFLVNVQRYFEVLNYATNHKIPHVIYASSGGVYQPKQAPFDEEDNLALSGDLGFYLGSKICAENISKAFSSLLDIKILRFFFVYGEAQKENMLIPRLIKNIKENQPITLEGANGILINPIYVSDATSAIQRVLHLKGSNVFNVGGGRLYTLREICDIISQEIGNSPKFIVQQDSPIKKICGNIRKLEQIGWSPKVSIPEGIQRLISLSVVS
jgi:UDP-glucose 4-epimerase